jgi:bifunctional non-homologous end joining protein LigD
LSLVRCPEGYTGECFYQKHVNNSLPTSIQGVWIQEKDNEMDEYIYIKDTKGLEGLSQMSVLEIHPWSSSLKNIETPDRIIFDLDPDTKLDWEEVIKLCFLMKEKLEALNLASFVKTTGGKGLHIVVPIKRQFDWDTVKSFAQSFTESIVMTNPKLYLSTMAKSKRVGKIFIDYFRNTRGATAVAAYSTRAQKGAPISTPLAWSELNKKIRSDQYNISNIFKRLSRLKNDPWEEFYKTRQSLSKTIKKLS